MSDVQPEATNWTWINRIPAGELTLLAGREGGGKSTLAYDLAAQLSLGILEGDFKDKPAGTIVVATEDDLRRTIVPRLMAAEADLERIVQVRVNDQDEGIKDEVSLPIDLELLADVIEAEDVRLMILDPLLSRLDVGLDTHKDSDVRRALEPLVDMAQSCECSVLGIIHVNKHSGTDALSRVMGSRAFTAVSRSVLYVIEDPDDEKVRIIGRPKSNIGGDAPSQSFTIVSEVVGYDDAKQKEITTGRIEWGEHNDESINGILKRSESKGEHGPKPEAREAAQNWLFDHLTDRPCMSAVYLADAKADGISESTLKRAAKAIGVVVTGKGKLTSWQQPKLPVPVT